MFSALGMAERSPPSVWLKKGTVAGSCLIIEDAGSETVNWLPFRSMKLPLLTLAMLLPFTGFDLTSIVGSGHQVFVPDTSCNSISLVLVPEVDSLPGGVQYQ